MGTGNEYLNIIETLVSIFTVDRGILKVMLMRKRSEPYKGYWILPGNIVTNHETLEQNAIEATYEKIGIPDLYMEQCSVFSGLDRDPDERIIAVSFIGLIDTISIELKREIREEFETEWFALDAIPKLAYDHKLIIETSIAYLKKKIVNSNVLKSLFPSDFTLPELQRVYEQIFGRELDRRNFRKKFLNLGLIEDTGYKNEGTNGRPATLYRFKESVPDKDLF